MLTDPRTAANKRGYDLGYDTVDHELLLSRVVFDTNYYGACPLPSFVFISTLSTVNVGKHSLSSFKNWGLSNILGACAP